MLATRQKLANFSRNADAPSHNARADNRLRGI